MCLNRATLSGTRATPFNLDADINNTSALTSPLSSSDSIIEDALMDKKTMVTPKWTKMYLFIIYWNIL